MEGLPFPAGLRDAIRKVELRTRVEYGSEKERLASRLIGALTERIKFLDRAQRQADTVAKEFLPGYLALGTASKDDAKIMGHSMVRKYEREDGYFDFKNDQLAPDSVVVRRYTCQNLQTGGTTSGEPHIFWISKEKGPDGTPVVFHLLWIDTGPGKVKIKALPMLSETTTLDLFRAGTISDPGNGYQFAKTLEVWKKGTTSSQKVKAKTVPLLRSATPQLSPIPVPI